MSGIFGLFWRNGRPAGPETLAAMDAALAHRGGDGQGTWHDGAVGLGSRLRHTTPESLRER
ncbi:MAG: hypothetical protein KC425_05885, partial [Anaerolineales bacterium]|nr:hypothetical protein [Anaerolineales bacterium]